MGCCSTKVADSFTAAQQLGRGAVYGAHAIPALLGNDALPEYFPALARIGQAIVAFHGDNRPLAAITRDGGLQRYVSETVSTGGSPALMDGGGTKNTVTTARDFDVSVSYACRGGAVHTYRDPLIANRQKRYVYVFIIRRNEGIDLSQLPRGTGPYQLSDHNARTGEVLTLTVPLAQIVGCQEMSLVNKRVDRIDGLVWRANPAFDVNLLAELSAAEATLLANVQRLTQAAILPV